MRGRGSRCTASASRRVRRAGPASTTTSSRASSSVRRAPRSPRRRDGAGAELIDRLSSLMPAFAEYMETLDAKPQRWTRDRLGAVIDVGDVLDAKVHAMEAHQTQAPDLAMWATARAKLPEIFREETFTREYPEPGGAPLESDLFAGLRGG